MIIINNGMYRSGSTLSYNVLRMMLELNDLGGGFGTEAAGICGPIQTAMEGRESDIERIIAEYDERWVVIKAHKLDATKLKGFGGKRAKAVFTYRHPLDIAASMMRVFGRPFPELHGVTDPLGEDVDYYFAQQDNPDVLMVRYEAFYNQPKALAQRLAAFIGIGVTDEQLVKIEHECSADEARKVSATLTDVGLADPVTQLRGRHISSTGGVPGSFRHFVDAPTEKMVREKMVSYFKAAGYE